MDVDQFPEQISVRKPHWAVALAQVVVCCGQIPTQTAIAAILMVAGITPEVDGAVTLSFFAALTLIDTVVVITLMKVFLTDSGESSMTVFFGARQRPHGPYNLRREVALGVISTPMVLVGALIVVATLRALVPGLHNVPVSPFESFFTTPARAAVFTFVAIVAGGVREELQRGFLLHRFDQSLGGMKVGLAIFSVIFGAAHYTQGYDIAVVTGLLGLFWGWLYLKRRSVAAAMVSHAGFNGTQVLQQLIIKLAS